MLPPKPAVSDSYARELDVIAVDFSFNTPGLLAGLPIGAFPAGAVLGQAKWQIVTPFNAVTTNVLTVGTNATRDDILSASDVTEGSAGAGLSSTGLTLGPFATDTPIYALFAFTGGAPTAGRAIVVMTFVKPERL